MKHKMSIDRLWRRRALLLREISLLLGLKAGSLPIEVLKAADAFQARQKSAGNRRQNCNGQAPPENGGQAPLKIRGRVSNTKQQRLKGLLNSLKTVRMQLFMEWKKRFAGVFARAQAKYDKEGRAILEEKLLQCIDRCQCGQEQTFAGYFLKYALRGFSEIEDDRMAGGFSMPRKKKLLYRRFRRSIQDANGNWHRDLADTMNEDIDVIIGVMEAPLHRSSYTDTCLAY